MKIIKTLEENVHHFVIGLKTEAANTKEASIVIQKYIKEGSITKEEELLVKTQMVDSLKIIGVLIPFVLIPGASILMPLLIKVAAKYNIELLPASFSKEKRNKAKEAKEIKENNDIK